MLVEPLYIVMPRILDKKLKNKILRPPKFTCANRDLSDSFADARSQKGRSAVVYECKIVSIHHPSKKARKKLKKLLRRRR